MLLPFFRWQHGETVLLKHFFKFLHLLKTATTCRPFASYPSPSFTDQFIHTQHCSYRIALVRTRRRTRSATLHSWMLRANTCRASSLKSEFPNLQNKQLVSATSRSSWLVGAARICRKFEHFLLACSRIKTRP